MSATSVYHPGLACNGRCEPSSHLRALKRDRGVREAVNRLRGWDFTTPTGLAVNGYDGGENDGDDSVAATIYAVWRSRVLANTVDAFVDSAGLPKPEGGETRTALRALRHLLDNFDLNQGVGASGIEFFVTPFHADPETRRDFLLLQSLRKLPNPRKPPMR